LERRPKLTSPTPTVPDEEVVTVMSMHKLTAGSGYDYLTKQVARNDSAAPGVTPLADYYDEKGEAPGVWVGSGVVGLDGLAEGDTVTAEQMTFLFGQGEHPLAAERVAALGPHPTDEQLREAVLLGTPFRQPDTNTNIFRSELLRRYQNWNQEQGNRREAKVPDHVRADLRTHLAVEWFTAIEHRAPNTRELTGFIARMSRPPATPVAGWDLTFSPVKSVSALWALADRPTAALIEAAHQAAVRDALRYIEAHVLKTRKGHAGVEQVDVTGLVAAAFTHRDTRAGDPDLHTHVAVANKVRAVIDGQWRAIDGRVMHTAITSASETYNTALEAHLTASLGVRFVDIPRTDGRRPVREIDGVDPRLIRLWSTRRKEITHRAGELAMSFQLDHGRPPTPAERQELYQVATLETREAKHEPRSRNEQRSTWHEQAIAALGQDGVDAMLRHVRDHSPAPAPVLDPEWFQHAAAQVIANVEDHRADWQAWHVRAEALRLARAAGLSPDQLETGIPQLVVTALSTCISLDSPDDGIREPDVLRRSDGTSVYRVTESTRYTSSRMLAAEQRIIHAAGQTDGCRTSPNAVNGALLAEAANGTTLNEGQIQLVRDLATSGCRVQLALAPAGTGKTTAMRALATAWTSTGGNVLGLAPSATAASQLAEELGDYVHADTLHKLAYEIGRPEPADWARRVDANSLLIVDEAGMADTLRLDAVIGWAMTRGASVRLVGDDQQLGAVSAGGVLRDITAAYGAVRLDEVVRFADSAEAYASLALRDGDSAALGFYLDHDRIHVGDATTTTQLVFDAWLSDKRRGFDTVMLAPTRDQVAALNLQARQYRLRDDPPDREVGLSDGNHASVGDSVITRRNDRRLRAGSEWVKNGDRWYVDRVRDDGSLDSHDLRTSRRVWLPSEYVRDHVELGYASTIHAAQGITAETCHGLLTGQESREQLYTMLTRGRFENHAYVEVTGDGDPHTRFRPDAIRPPTPTERLEAILARSDVPSSATSQILARRDPRTLLGAAVACYQDAMVVAAEQFAGPDLIRQVEEAATEYGLGLTEADAWPALRSHLCVGYCQGLTPISSLMYATDAKGIHDARDPAALADQRLSSFDAVGAGSSRPLPWVPAIPWRLSRDSQWGDYLTARHDVIVQLSDQVRQDAETRPTVPVWAAMLTDPPLPDVIADVEVWRAAHRIPDSDLKPTGPVRKRALESLAQRGLDDLIAEESEPVLNWIRWIHEAAPSTVKDPGTTRLARDCAQVDPDGTRLRVHVEREAYRPLPDEHKADALRYRLERWLKPAWKESGQSTAPRRPAEAAPEQTPRPSAGIGR
jgi:conjugative relaxase-like TrwC/TraI family protein